jgi:protein TonB
MFNSVTIDSYGLEKKDYISISIEIPKIPTKNSNKTVNRAEAQESMPSVEKPQDVNVEDLFSDVQTKKIIKPKKKVVNSRRIKEIQKQIKTAKKNSVKSFSEKISNLDAKEKSNESNPTSAGSEVNEYLAKINALVYKYFNPPQNSDGNSVRAVIELSVIGKVISFRVLTYSSNELLNKECDEIETRLMGEIFPINPQNKSSRTIVILTSKE